MPESTAVGYSQIGYLLRSLRSPSLSGTLEPVLNDMAVGRFHWT